MLKQRILSEIIWICIALLVAAAVVLPPYLAMGSFYSMLPNTAIIFAFVSVLRLLFFSTSSPWLQPLFMKGVTIVAAVPLFLFTVLTMNDIQTLIDAEGFAALFSDAAQLASIDTWGRFIRNEVIFFGAGLIVLLVVLPFVLLVQAWRQVKASQRASQHYNRQRLV